MNEPNTKALEIHQQLLNYLLNIGWSKPKRIIITEDGGLIAEWQGQYYIEFEVTSDGEIEWFASYI